MSNLKTEIMTVSNEASQTLIRFKGIWLEVLGFSHETIVTCSFNNDILTVKAHGIGLDVYQSLVKDVRQNKQYLCQVLNMTRYYKNEPNLIIEGLWLTRQGFNIGDIILYKTGCKNIQIKKLDIAPIGFDTTKEATYKVIHVQKTSKHGKIIPRIQIQGKWLNDFGFHLQQSILVGYETNGIQFTAQKGKKEGRSNGGTPPHINMGQNLESPYIQLKGAWLIDIGYNIGDKLIIQIKQGIINLKPLKDTHLSF